MKISGETHYLWRAVDYKGKVREVFVTKHRDRKAVLQLRKRVIKQNRLTKEIVTDRLQPYQAAMNVISNAAYQECG